MFALAIIGGLIGYAIGRLPGIIIGAALGYWLGRVLHKRLIGYGSAVQTQFLESTFAVMGALCKADGRVTRDEIQVAETLFERLRLSPDRKAAAKTAFNRGKAADFDLDGEIDTLNRVTRGNRILLQLFLQVQLSAVAADGVLHPEERRLLLRIAHRLGLPEAEIDRLEAMLRGGEGGGQRQSLDDAYKVLGVDASASDAEVKKAYRRLMSQNHPDKLAAKGLPESMREVAEERTREIANAYERIKAARE